MAATQTKIRKTESAVIKTDPHLDLVLERVIDVPRSRVWEAWTNPEHLKKWFTPEPWKTVDCEMDLRPGGIFRTVMRSPEGQEFPNVGCFLEIVENEKLVWTSALLPGYRPANLAPTPGHECAELAMTAIILLESQGSKTKYTAIVLHADPEGRRKHEEMGFHEGWGTALDQLVAHMQAV
jgi:uncharacterized protein YndB with AHSA1/START domain